jgi:hypothetical protein
MECPLAGSHLAAGTDRIRPFATGWLRGALSLRVRQAHHKSQRDIQSRYVIAVEMALTRSRFL